MKWQINEVFYQRILRSQEFERMLFLQWTGGRTDFSAESLKPSVGDAFACLRVADREPDTGEPVGDEDEHEDEED